MAKRSRIFAKWDISTKKGRTNKFFSDRDFVSVVAAKNHIEKLAKESGANPARPGMSWFGGRNYALIYPSAGNYIELLSCSGGLCKWSRVRSLAALRR